MTQTNNPLPSELQQKLEGFYHSANTDGMNGKYDNSKASEVLELFEQELSKREREARSDEVENIVEEEYFHPSGRHMGAVRYHVMRLRELSEGDK